jgi:hypothetical protein
MGRRALCHPDRHHWALELCKPCYDVQWGAQNREIRNAQQRARFHREAARPGYVPKLATCHPDRRLAARGLCWPCYRKNRP